MLAHISIASWGGSPGARLYWGGIRQVLDSRPPCLASTDRIRKWRFRAACDQPFWHRT